MLDLVFSDEESFDIEIGYWKEKLQGFEPLQLTTDFARSSVLGADKETVEFSVDQEINQQLNLLSKANHVSLFTVLLSAFKVLLFRYSNQEDICVGNVVTGQVPNSTAKYVNTIALRSKLHGNDKFTDLLERVNITTIEAYHHQYVPFEKVVNCLNEKNNENDLFSLFKAVFIRADHLNEQEAGKISQHLTTHDIILIASESEEGIEGRIEYSADLYHKDTINRMIGHYCQLLRSIVEDPEKSIGALPMLTKPEVQDILVNFNNTLTYYPVEKTIVDIFEEQVEKTPDAVALRQHEKVMTYRELNERANQLAGYLLDHGVNKGDNIGLLAARSFNMIIGMYGIMKAGGAYVPIDPEYPADRQEYILTNSFVHKVVADGDYQLEQAVPADQFVKINNLDLSGYDITNPGLKIDSKQLAYTIYTSGSTGRPKGVMIEHHSAVNLILWVNSEFNIGADDRLLFITSMCFDLSVYDIFGMLAAGGSIVIVEQHELMDVPKLKDMLSRYNITFWDSVPTTMDYLVRELESQDKEYIQTSLRVVFMSGDWIPVNLPNRTKKYFPNTRVISLGGATEGTVWSNFYPVEQVESDWSSIPYGRPMNNNFFYILNDQQQPVPIGVAGELYIGGVGVARGYANDKEKTDYSFVRDPFNSQAGGRMYRTGDLGRMLPDLNMEFIGRKDNQVKIRGYRIELGEIESVLRQCDMVEQTVVLATADKENKKRLVSYVVGKAHYNREAVISFLKGKLPDYMVPTLWMELDSLPLTSNGKIDKKALPDFNAEEQLKDKYVAPRNESERVLAEIWQQVLKLNSIGINDNFFDIGGHSLMAVQIMTKIENRIGKKFPIAILFKYPTVEALAEFIRNDHDAAANWKSLVPIKSTGNKMPVYIVHGEGLNTLNFSNLALLVDPDQPVYGLQAKGLDGVEEPFDSIAEIAAHYVHEIIEHNPFGPYAIAGYSIGGFIAVEMVKQLQSLNKDVKMLAIFDTDAEGTEWNEPWYVILPKKAKRYLPKFMGGSKSFYKQLNKKTQEKAALAANKLGLKKKSESDSFFKLLDKIKTKHFQALGDYKLTPFDSAIHLFKAQVSVHYNKDDEYLAWKKFALKGVERHLVPGDHFSMLYHPHVSEFAVAFQKALDNC
jgi:amino acid adenylation domain-containing protein